MSRSSLEETYAATQYFRAANWARLGCYVPQAVSFLVARFWPGSAYVALLIGLHLTLVFAENYKRALCVHWIPLAQDGPPESCDRKAVLPSFPYRLLRFETEAFYRRIGLNAFRVFVTWVMSTLTYGLGKQKMEFIAQPSRRQVVAFEYETRVSETVHWFSAASMAPLVVLSWLGAPTAVAVWSTVIIWGDLMLALLQRFHRARVWPYLTKIAARKK